MIVAQLIKRIKQDTWWSEESPAVLMFCLWMREFVNQSKYWHPKLPTVIFNFLKNDFVYEETPEGEKLEIWNFVWRQYLRTPGVQMIRYRQWRRAVGGITETGDKFLRERKKLANAQIAASFMRLARGAREHWRFTWVQESADVFSSYKLPGLIQQSVPGSTMERANDIALTLCAPVSLSFMECHQVGILKLAIRHYPELRRAKRFSTCSTILQKDCRVLSARYVWIRTNYKEGPAYTPEHVFSEVRHECRTRSRIGIISELKQLRSKTNRARIQQQRLYRTLKLPISLRAACGLLSWWAQWTDERKEVALKINWYLEAYAREISQRLKRNVWDVKYMTAEEIASCLRGEACPSRTITAQRRRGSVLVVTKQRGRVQADIVTGAKFQQLWGAVFRAVDTSNVKGQVASAPVTSIRGRAQVVLDVSKQKFIAGRVLVTTMTRPEFVPLMRKAKAIVTDEGGLTSHAAIVSRELGIPCIIGTKVATKAFKSGDTVELDLRTGSVRRLG